MFYLSIGFYFQLVSFSHSLWWKMILFNWYHTFQLVFYAPNENYFQLVYANILNIGIKNLKLVLFSIWYLYCKTILVFNQKDWFMFSIGIKSVKYFQLVLILQLVSRLPIRLYLSIDIKIFVGFFKIFFFNWYHKLISWCFDVYLHAKLIYFSIGIIMFWFVLLICKGKLNIFSIYIFMLSVSHIEEFDRSSLCLTRM